MHQNTFAAGVPPGTPLGQLTTLPRPPNWIWGGEGGDEKEGRGREGKEVTEEGRKGRIGEGRTLKKKYEIIEMYYGPGRECAQQL